MILKVLMSNAFLFTINLLAGLANLFLGNFIVGSLNMLCVAFHLYFVYGRGEKWLDCFSDGEKVK